MTSSRSVQSSLISIHHWARVSFLLCIAAFLAACNAGSLGEGLESSRNPQPSQGIGAAPSQNPANTPQIVAPGENTASLSPNVPAVGTPVAFLPVSNAPQSAVSTLAQSIRNAAQSSALPVVASVQQGAQYQVKGYFSALEDGNGTLLVYVWDVLDRNNRRVYRINGQEQTSARSADPWGAVSPDMLERVAQSTVSQLKTWLSSRSAG